MDLGIWLILAGVVAAFLLFKRLTLISPGAAHQWLQQGALVIDVRSADEFQAGHLPGALSVPLDQLRQQVDRRALDKDQPLLLHCLSGTRSGLAKTMLRDLGYRNVFNLGSLGRARRILSGQSTGAKKS